MKFPSLLFSQTRIGKNGIRFKIYKFRTMYPGAQKDQDKYRHLNEADGPVFKIRDDPRYTKIGRWLAKTGLDELPQIINVLKGEMALVGPRPLPPDEEKQIPAKWRLKRRSVKPGLTSSWVIGGSHWLTFGQWMELDIQDIARKNLWYDAVIIAKTGLLVIKNLLQFGNHAAAAGKLKTAVE